MLWSTLLHASCQVAGVEEAVDIINSKPKPLVVHVFSEEKRVFEQFLAHTSSGVVISNDTFVFVSCKILTNGVSFCALHWLEWPLIGS